MRSHPHTPATLPLQRRSALPEQLLPPHHFIFAVRPMCVSSHSLLARLPSCCERTRSARRYTFPGFDRPGNGRIPREEEYAHATPSTSGAALTPARTNMLPGRLFIAFLIVIGGFERHPRGSVARKLPAAFHTRGVRNSASQPPEPCTHSQSASACLESLMSLRTACTSAFVSSSMPLAKADPVLFHRFALCTMEASCLAS